MHLSNGVKLIFFSISVLILCRGEDYSYGANNPYTISDSNSTCVDLMEIFPVPNSILKPIFEGEDFSDYLFHFWYSHPIKIHTAPIAYLSISFSLNSSIYPYYAAYYGEGETSVMSYFRIPSDLKIARLVAKYREQSIYMNATIM